MNELSARRVVVVGLGVSGAAAAAALAQLGARVRVTEGASSPAVEERAAALRARGVDVETGGHDLDALDADVAVLSPGIPPDAPVVRALAARGVELMSEIELAYRLADCDFLAVTGTNGKTTTTSLLAAMLAEGGVKSVAAGNIGLPLVEAVERIPAGGAIALEVSSFQLATTDRFHARVAVLLNVAEDHIDWHGSFEDYFEAKARVVRHQGRDDVFLPNLDDARAMEVAARTAARVTPFSARRAPGDGIGVSGTAVVWRGRQVAATGDVSLPGVGGLEDAVAAAGAALEYGVDPGAVRRALRAFRPLRHRLELVAESGGVRYVDDSKATNPHATVVAVEGMRDVVLIAGGRSKGIDLTPLRAAVPPVVAVVALGEAAPEVERVLGDLVPVERVATMDDAVRAARARSVRGGSVLLSPGCASLDMYESYAHRGDDFTRAVRASITEDAGAKEG
ncbi:MAG TPA: UDP-N-acetylmuramoyl-L-alanine--D-glutamate ligase [Actinomycetota bacterium]|nr:UDP-N-acetylmuramoyl-L-alanine--D-glutamate ligase [Actinomycetota bacterium]